MKSLAPRLLPDIPLLYVFPGGEQVHVRLKDLSEGSETRDVIRFYTRLYGQPVLFDPMTMLYLGPERRRYRREAA